MCEQESCQETDVNVNGCGFTVCAVPKVCLPLNVRWRSCTVIFDIRYGVCIKADKRCYGLHNQIIFHHLLTTQNICMFDQCNCLTGFV